jgi:hypothetical protein
VTPEPADVARTLPAASIALLARDLGRSPRFVQVHLRHLERIAYVETSARFAARGDQLANVYRIKIPLEPRSSSSSSSTIPGEDGARYRAILDAYGVAWRTRYHLGAQPAKLTGPQRRELVDGVAHVARELGGTLGPLPFRDAAMLCLAAYVRRDGTVQPSRRGYLEERGHPLELVAAELAPIMVELARVRKQHQIQARQKASEAPTKWDRVAPVEAAWLESEVARQWLPDALRRRLADGPKLAEHVRDAQERDLAAAIVARRAPGIGVARGEGHGEIAGAGGEGERDPGPTEIVGSQGSDAGEPPELGDDPVEPGYG